MKKQKLIISLITGVLILYSASYVYSSRIGMNDNTLSAENKTVWAFGLLVQQIHVYFDTTTPEYKNELKKRRFYYPLIKLDRYLFNNYHILESELPFLGG